MVPVDEHRAHAVERGGELVGTERPGRHPTRDGARGDRALPRRRRDEHRRHRHVEPLARQVDELDPVLGAVGTDHLGER